MIICGLSTSAQNRIYELHPIIGDTIDHNEIKKYYLFSDYINDSVDYLILYKNNDFFTLVGISDSTRVLNVQLNKDEVLLQKEQVEKLNNYYGSVLKKDSSNLKELINKPMISDSFSIKNINLNIATPEFIKSVKKDIRRKYWEEYRKETRNNRKRGMMY